MRGGTWIRWFYRELKRRHVIRVVVAYAAVAWLVIQIGETTFEPLGLPPGALTFVVVITILGFPVAAVLAWTLQVVREAPAGEAPAGTNGAAAGGERPPLVLSNLPAAPAPLVGRGRELEDAERALTAEGCRVLTILGPPGVGKTRFSLDLARRVAPSFRNGVCFAAVARLHSPDALPFLLAERLGVGLASGSDAWAATLAFLREKQLLLLIDNFEQLTEGSGLLAEVVRTAPGVALVVTSRERLDVQGEMALRLEGLPCPAADSAGPDGSDAVQLFVQSARRVDRRFALDAARTAEVGRICRLVEGLPLALELAAACVGVLSPAEIAREIEQRHDFPLGSRGLPPRHRSLRAAFESSWSLLEPGERDAFRRLTVFHGGFGRAAAEAVADADLPVLAALVDKSLLRRHDSGRFDLLEIVRQFGREKLAADATEERAVRDRHAEYCTTILEESIRRSDAGEVEAALSAVAWDAENIRAAWAWAVEHRDLERLGRGAAGLFRLWEWRGLIEEGRELFQRAAEAVEAGDNPAADPLLLGVLLARWGAFAEYAGAYDDAADLLARASVLLGDGGPDRERAFVLQIQSWVDRAHGHFDAARAQAEESVALFERAGDTVGMAAARTGLGAHAYFRGDYDRAKHQFRESLALYRRAGAVQGVWKQLNNLAGVAMFEGDYAEARRLLEEILPLYREHQNPVGAARALFNLGVVENEAGEYRRALPILEEAVEAGREVGLGEVVVQGLVSLAAARLALGDVRGALHEYRRAADGAAEMHHLPLWLDILVGLARLKAHEGDRDVARRLLGIASLHPAADENTRRDAEALLRELGEDVGAATPLDPPDADALRDLAVEVMQSGAPVGQSAS